MKLFAKAALGALMLAGATALGATPAAAHVSVGFGFGFGGYGPYYGYPGYYDASCDPRSRWYDPYRCDYYDDYDDYYGPVFIDGFWFDGGFRSRFGFDNQAADAPFRADELANNDTDQCKRNRR